MDAQSLQKAIEELTLEGAVNVMDQALANIQGNRFDAMFFQHVSQMILKALADAGAIKVDQQPVQGGNVAAQEPAGDPVTDAIAGAIGKRKRSRK